MLLLGHVGITFGVALAAETLSPRARHSVPGPLHGTMLTRMHAAIVSLASRVDLRILLVASLLPDIIDKPVGLLFFPDVFGTGRLFAHALIFPVVLALAGAWHYRARSSTALLTLAYGAAMHLALDAMWRTPGILLWPFVRPLPRGAESEAWFSRLLTTLLTNPAAYLPEIVGAILLIPLLWVVLRWSGLKRFLRFGAVD
jgi:inner membrane protein